jgi:hypothetical protein
MDRRHGVDVEQQGGVAAHLVHEIDVDGYTREEPEVADAES